MKFAKVRYTGSGKGQGQRASINVKLPSGSWSGEKEFVRNGEYTVPLEVYQELEKLGGFERVDVSVRAENSKVEAPKKEEPVLTKVKAPRKVGGFKK